MVRIAFGELLLRVFLDDVVGVGDHLAAGTHRTGQNFCVVASTRNEIEHVHAWRDAEEVENLSGLAGLVALSVGVASAGAGKRCLDGGFSGLGTNDRASNGHRQQQGHKNTIHDGLLLKRASGLVLDDRSLV